MLIRAGHCYCGERGDGGTADDPCGYERFPKLPERPGDAGGGDGEDDERPGVVAVSPRAYGLPDKVLFERGVCGHVTGEVDGEAAGVVADDPAPVVG